MAFVEKFCQATLNYLENETQFENIQRLRLQYNELSSFAESKLTNLQVDGQFLILARLEKNKQYHDEILAKASLSLSSPSKMLHYAQSLQRAVEATQKELDEMEKNPKINPIEQLSALRNFSHTHYTALHTRLVNNAKTQLAAYKNILNQNLQMISAVIPALTNNKNVMTAIETKIKTKICEADALTVNYATRLHFWNIFNSSVSLNELPPHQLRNYLNQISQLVQAGILEITQDANNAGFRFK